MFFTLYIILTAPMQNAVWIELSDIFGCNCKLKSSEKGHGWCGIIIRGFSQNASQTLQNAEVESVMSNSKEY
jgi:hypothetical protein